MLRYLRFLRDIGYARTAFDPSEANRRGKDF
jgi:hypothetical protein